MLLKYEGPDKYAATVGGQPADQSLLDGATKVFAAHLGVAEASVGYLLQYGFTQSMQDSIAGRAKRVRDEKAEKALADAKGDKLVADKWLADNATVIDAEVKSDVEGALNKRLDAIRNGTVGTRATGPRDELRAIARETVAAALTAKNTTASKEKFAELVQGLLDNPEKRAKLQKEFDRRAKAAVAIEI